MPRPFDRDRLSTLLEGLEVSILSTREWRQDNAFERLDSEYQVKAHLEAIETIKAFGAIQFREDRPEIIHPQEIKREYVEDDGIWFLRAQNVRPLGIDLSNQVFISKEDADALSRNEIRMNDVLVTRTGANRGECAMFDRAERTIASSHTFIIRPHKLDPEFLTIFFNTYHGKAQVDRGVYGAAQPEVAPYYLLNIWLPKVSSELMDSIKTVFTASRAFRAETEQRLRLAEDTLLSALGLANWTPPEPLSYSARASDVFAARRIDARFFAPRIQALLDILSRDDRTVADVADSRREAFRPGDCTTFHYIEIGDINGEGAAGSTLLACNEAPSRAKWYVRANDIITSTVRPIRRLSAQITPEQDGFVCSSGFVVIQPQTIAPELLLTYLRLPVICELLDLYASASMYPAITNDHVFGLPMPKIDKTVATQVVQNVKEARAAQATAAKLLEAAKSAVEIAIEDGENAAVAFLNQIGGTN